MKKLLEQTKKLLEVTHRKWDDLQRELKEKAHKQDELVTYHKPVHSRRKTNPVVEISVGSITKGALAIIGILALIYFLYSIQATLVLLFVSLILAAAIDPVVDKWEKRKIPRGVGVIGLYVLSLLIFGAVVYALIPIMVEQTITLTQNIGKFINNILTNGMNGDFPFAKEIKPFLDSYTRSIDKQQVISQLQNVLSQVSSQLANIAGNSFAALGAIFNGIFNAVLVMVITYFMVVDKLGINKFIHSLIPSRHAHYFALKTHQMQNKIGGWVRGQFLLCLTIGIMSYLGLWFLQLFGIDIQYKETLAVVAGVTEIIPYLGPVIGAIPAVLIAANVSGWAVLVVILLYAFLQALENNVLVPMIMNKEVGLSPIIVIMAMLLGAQFFGILGILLAIPVATSIEVLVQDYIDKEK